MEGFETSLGGVLNELRHEARKIGEQAGTVHSSALKLSAAFEKLMELNRAGSDKFQAGSAQLKHMLKLPDAGPKG
jgi:hypothetical protein